MVITKKQVLKAVLLPEIFPRLRKLFGSGFDFLAYLIVLVYNTVRILPDNHPYMNPKNIGSYSIRQAIAQAANHIKCSRKNIDQVLIFFSIIAALIILLIQFILLIVAMAIPRAEAALPTKVEDFFKTPNPKEDIAFRMLDMVFGVPKVFESKEQVNTALHQALHGLFEFYSYGIIIVGAMIIIYFVVAIVSETAVSGTPFGQRFNKSWAVPRVIIFFGLLIPAGHGLNGGQYITLYTAKLGSGLASSGWVAFNDKIESENSTPTGKKEQNVAKIKAADLSHLPAFMLIVKTCEKAYRDMYNEKYLPASWKPSKGGETGVQAWAVYKTIETKGDTSSFVYKSEKMEGTTFTQLAEKSKGHDIHIVFGAKDEKAYEVYRAGIAPLCGTVGMKVTDVAEPGSAHIQNEYYKILLEMWQGANKIDEYSENYVRRYLGIDPIKRDAELPDKKYVADWIKRLEERMGDEEKGVIAEAIKKQIEEGKWQMPKEVKDYGWGGAGIWYNKLAQQNGALVSAVRQTPVTVLYPHVMELVKSAKAREDNNPAIFERFTFSFSDDTKAKPELIAQEKKAAQTMNHVYKFWEGAKERPKRESTGNGFIDAINAILGTQGLFEICKNTEIHPLAQLSALGKSMLDNSIQSFMAASGTGLMSILPSYFSASLKAGTSFFLYVAGIGLTIGFVLFYVLPFFPFIYFFFAVGTWVKSVFEAMVAMPLWALAHLRIDGEGIPGEAAIGGYYLIFDVFIRPILIVFGLVAAVTVFAAMVKVLNEVFYLVISNVSGHDPRSNAVCFKNPAASGSGSGSDSSAAITAEDIKSAFRGPVDEFMFTIVYTIMVYMIGQSCFKLIDLIPGQLLVRWAGVDMPPFGDDIKDPTGNLMAYSSYATNSATAKIQGMFGGK